MKKKSFGTILKLGIKKRN